MTDCVLDASAVVLAASGKGRDAEVLRARLPEMRRHAPHLIDAEVGNVLRRHERAGLLSRGEAETALWSLRVLVQRRYPHVGPLAELAWLLRDNLTFYDALYAALAIRLDAPLLTCDARLGRAPLDCRVEVLSPSPA